MNDARRYRFKTLGDALAEIHAWGSLEGRASALKLRDSCRLRVAPGDDVFLELAEDGPVRTAQLGDVVEALNGVGSDDPGWMDLGRVFERVRLVPGQVEPGEILLALPGTDEAFRALIDRLADYRVEGQKIVTLLSAEGELVGVKFRAPELELRAHELGLTEAELFVLTGPDGVHALPAGWAHPFLSSFPGLVPPITGAPEGDGHAVLAWRSAGEPEEGHWGALRVLRSWVRPAELLELSIASGQVIALGGATASQIDVELRPRRSAPGGDATALRGIVEVEDLSGGVTVQRLLDILDDLELGHYTADTRVWVHRTGRSRASRARYFIEADGAEAYASSHLSGLRVYLQPASLRDRGIPVFVESTSQLQPDPDAFLPELEQDHPFLERLREVFATDSEGAEVHLLRPGDSSTQGGAVFESLAGSRPLRDLLHSLEARPLGVLAREAVEDLTVRLSERSKEQFDELEELARQETAQLDDEFEGIASAFQDELDELDGRLADLHGKLESARDLVAPVEGLVESVPRTWDEVRTKILELDEVVVRGRLDWMSKLQTEIDVEQAALIDQARELEDVVTAAGVLLRAFDGHRKDVEAGFKKLKATMERIQKARQAIVDLGEKTRLMSQDAAKELAAGRSALGQVEEREGTRQAELEREHYVLLEKELGLLQQVERLNRDREELDRRMGQVKQQTKDARRREEQLRKKVAELEQDAKELKRLTGTRLPALEKDLDRLQARHDPAALRASRSKKVEFEARIKQHRQSEEELRILEEEELPRLRSELASMEPDLEEQIEGRRDEVTRLEREVARRSPAGRASAGEPETGLRGLVRRAFSWFKG